MPTRSLYSFKQSLSDVLDIILQKSDADPPSTKPHNLSPLFVVTKLLLCNMSISLMKDALYSVLS